MTKHPSDSFREIAAPEQKRPQEEQIAPQVHIHPIPAVCDRKPFPVPDHRSQHADDVLVGNAGFPLPAIVPAEDIIIPAHLENPVKDILITVAPVQGHVVFLQPSLRLAGDQHQIPALSDEGQHAVALIPVDQIATAPDFLLKAGFTHPAHQFSAACSAPCPHRQP